VPELFDLRCPAKHLSAHKGDSSLKLWHVCRRRTEAVVSAAEEARSSAQAALSDADLKQRRKAAEAIYGER
jgi:hypothetical protein